MADAEYMNEKQMAFFRLKLLQLKQEILNSALPTYLVSRRVVMAEVRGFNRVETSRTIIKSKEQVFAQTSVLDIRGYDAASPYAVDDGGTLVSVAAEEQETYKTIPQLEKAIAATKKQMEKAARDLDFMEAARLRDEMFALQKQAQEMKR